MGGGGGGGAGAGASCCCLARNRGSVDMVGKGQLLGSAVQILRRG